MPSALALVGGMHRGPAAPAGDRRLHARRRRHRAVHAGLRGRRGQITELAEVGVVLLLFALGVEFSLRELAPVAAGRRPGRASSRSSSSLVRRRARRRSRSGSTCATGARRRGCRRPSARRSSSSRCSRAGRARQPPRPRRGRLDDRPGPRDDRVHRGAAAARRRRPRRSRSLLALLRAARVPRRWRTSSARGCCRGCSGRSPGSDRRELFLLAVFATALLAAFISSARCSACPSRSGRSSAGCIV